jgi:hypothetical protein
MICPSGSFLSTTPRSRRPFTAKGNVAHVLQGRHAWWIGKPIFTFEDLKVRDKAQASGSVNSMLY